MWRYEDVKNKKMIDRPPLLEEPFAQTLSGKMPNFLKISLKVVFVLENIDFFIVVALFEIDFAWFLSKNQQNQPRKHVFLEKNVFFIDFKSIWKIGPKVAPKTWIADWKSMGKLANHVPEYAKGSKIFWISLKTT